MLCPAPTDRTMRTAPPPATLVPLLLLVLLAAPGPSASRAESVPARQPDPERQPRPLPGPGPWNATQVGAGAAAGGYGSSNSSGDALVTRISTLLRDLPTLKAAVIVACTFTALLIACLLLRVFRSGKRLKKTRKYDIITTPAERVEMAPLNEEDDEDEDSTVFDIKYRGVELEAMAVAALSLPFKCTHWPVVAERSPGYSHSVYSLNLSTGTLARMSIFDSCSGIICGQAEFFCLMYKAPSGRCRTLSCQKWLLRVTFKILGELQHYRLPFK